MGYAFLRATATKASDAGHASGTATVTIPAVVGKTALLIGIQIFWSFAFNANKYGEIIVNNTAGGDIHIDINPDLTIPGVFFDTTASLLGGIPASAQNTALIVNYPSLVGGPQADLFVYYDYA